MNELSNDEDCTLLNRDRRACQEPVVSISNLVNVIGISPVISLGV